MSIETDKKERVYESVLAKWLDESKINLHQFSLLHRIPYATLYPIYKGVHKPLRRVASRICRATRGELTLKDFGIDG